MNTHRLDLAAALLVLAGLGLWAASMSGQPADFGPICGGPGAFMQLHCWRCWAGTGLAAAGIALGAAVRLRLSDVSPI